MKKILTLAAAVSLLVATESKAQLKNGSVAPNFTLTDINGNVHDLYTYLNSGKTVFVDFSATWCGPCWSFHGTGYWDNLYQNHGPLGAPNVLSTTTNDVMVIFIEADDQTTSADLNGTGPNTQGNWVTGTMYPIVDDNTAAVNTLNTNYAIGYFPTLYMICPDRMVTEVSSSLGSGNAYYNLINSTPCIKATNPLDAGVKNGYDQQMVSTCDSVNPTIWLTNNGTSNLTSAVIDVKVNGVTQKTVNWTGSLPTYNVATLTNVKVMGTIGTNTITATVSSPNGGADANASNNNTGYKMINATMTPAKIATVSEGFQTAVPPANWGNLNGGSATYQWVSANVGGFQASTKSAHVHLWDVPAGDIDELVIQTFDFSGYATVSMTFDLAKAAISGQYDRLRVRASTDCGKTWTTVYYKYDNASTNPLQTVMSSVDWTPNASSNWRTETINLNSYAGNNNVLIKFQTISDYSNNIYIDNINLATTMGVNGAVQSANNILLFPNPTSMEASLEIGLLNEQDVEVTVFNNLGQVVMNENHKNMAAGDHLIKLSTENWSNGLYNVVVKTGQTVTTQKLQVSK